MLNRIRRHVYIEYKELAVRVYGPMGKWSSHHPFTVESPVRTWVGSPILYAHLAEWSKAPVLKTGSRQRLLGSNPRVCAREHYMREVFTNLEVILCDI